MYSDFYFIQDDILYRSVMDNGHKFSAAVIPAELTDTVYILRSQSIWSQWFPENLCCNQVQLLLEGNEETHSGSLLEKQIFEPGVQSMEFVCIDLIGELHPPSKGNRYALTAVCMLTSFTFCIPIKDKSAEKVITAWRNHISFPFGVCRNLLIDNGNLKMIY